MHITFVIFVAATARAEGVNEARGGAGISRDYCNEATATDEHKR
jgi:hypothetical protein